MSAPKSFTVTLGLITGLAALTVDVSLPSVPSIAEALSTSLSNSQLIVGFFIAGLACGQIPAGLLSDRLGRLPVLYIGVAVFTLAGAVASIATSIEVMLAARFVQGFGGAAAVVLSRTIVRDIASGEEAARLMSLMTMVFTAVPIAAPSLGAVLALGFGWRAPFYFLVIAGVAIVFLIRRTLWETHTPNPHSHPLRQLADSFSMFFSHRQSVFALLTGALLPAGYMSVITMSPALLTATYELGLMSYALVFASGGLSILIGSTINRRFVGRFGVIGMMGFSVMLFVIAGLQFGAIAWLNAAPLTWLWPVFCLYLLAVGILLPNATVLALDPLPRVAGVASSIIGTIHMASGAVGSLLGASIYDGSPRQAVLTIGIVCLLLSLVWLSKPVFCPELRTKATGSV